MAGVRSCRIWGGTYLGINPKYWPDGIFRSPFCLSHRDDLAGACKASGGDLECRCAGTLKEMRQSSVEGADQVSPSERK
jgi:hypothetical protein